MYNAALLDRAASATTCQILAAGGSSLVGVGTVGVVTGGVGFLPLSVGAAMLMAANYGCTPMDLGDATLENDQIDGCGEMNPGGYGQFQYKLPGGSWTSVTTETVYQTAIRLANAHVIQRSSDGKYVSQIEVYSETAGTTFGTGSFDTESEARGVSYRIDPIEGSCEPNGGMPSPPPEMFDPINYTDSVTNCNYTVQLQGFAQIVPGGPTKPVLKITQGAELRAGGVMGGCNWPDVIFTPGDGGPGSGPGGGSGGGGGDGPIIVPVPDDGPPPPSDGIPWWAAPLLAGSTAAGLALVGEAIDQLLQPKMAPGSFTLTAPCDQDAEGNPLTETWTYPEQSVDERLIAHQVSILEAIQTQLDWKTPICKNVPKLEGNFRTISFRSDETSPYGKSRLRKRFRYRSVSGLGLSELVDHWKDFTFEAGPVCVIHSGGSWGTPQVWASTADEGKRVIRHAGGEAGFDPDQDGKWTISGSDSARYGVSGTMRIDTTGGYFWITARDGSNQRPIVALT